jgi:predicted MFS family arabinose efflux permease
MFGGLFLLPLYLQQHLAMTTTGAGLMLLVLGLGSAVALPISGILTDRYGPVFTSIGGAMLLVVGTAPFISPLTTSVIAIAALFLTRGAGLALAQMPAMTAAYTLVDTSEKSDAAVLINVTQRIGGALGVVAVVITVEHGNAPDTATSCQWAFALLALFAIAAIVIIPKLSPAAMTTR